MLLGIDPGIISTFFLENLDHALLTNGFGEYTAELAIVQYRCVVRSPILF